MADIDVKPKTKSPAWIWIVLLVIVIALLYFFLRGTGGNNTDKQDSGADSSTSVLKKGTSNWYSAIGYPVSQAPAA
jgi:hypothetical protein